MTDEAMLSLRMEGQKPSSSDESCHRRFNAELGQYYNNLAIVEA